MSQTRATVTVHGRVQGVGFRFRTVREARRLGLTGWVRNTRHGTVEAVFEGDEGDVEAMVRWCHEGPAMAQVSKVDAEVCPATGQFSGFQVRG
jgi:acylphosphatase